MRRLGLLLVSMLIAMPVSAKTLDWHGTMDLEMWAGRGATLQGSGVATVDDVPVTRSGGDVVVQPATEPDERLARAVELGEQLTAMESRLVTLQVVEHPFPDHHRFQEQELEFGDQLPVMMTEKDAVKCLGFAQTHHWYVPVRAELDMVCQEKMLSLLERILDGASSVTSAVQ